MTEDDKPVDVPIEEQNFMAQQVIDFGDIRVARGLSRRPYPTCQHVHMVYDRSERRVWCEDCKTTLEGFDAFMVMVEFFQKMDREATRRLEEADKAKAAVVHRIAAKKLESIWRRKWAWPCPHCRGGILPEDVRDGDAVSREIEVARRKRGTEK